MLSSLAVLIGTASWSIGMVYSRSAALHPDDSMAAAMSLLAGAVMLLLGGTVTGEVAKLDPAVVSVKSLLALGYLAIVGSLVAYSAYFWLLNRFPPTLIATHTYVNPVVALVLGWALAGELLTARFAFGGVVVIAAIALVGRATSRKGEATKIRGQRPHASATQQKAAAKAMN
jgi:drug/metabolite transporter (DMT)-like permease